MIKLFVEQKNTDQIYLYWYDENQRISRKEYTVYRAIGDGDDYQKVGTSKSLSYIDSDQDAVLNPSHYYVVDANKNESEKVNVNNMGDPYVLKVAYDYSWTLNTAGNSILTQLYKIQKTQERCPDCYDTTTKIITKSNCETCGGSGYIRHYIGPIDCYLNIQQLTKKLDEMPDFESTSEYLVAWGSNKPILEIGDLVARTNGSIYIVDLIPNNTSINSLLSKELFVVKQDIVLKKVEGYQWILNSN